jgi:choline dehydrogenase-like flavoprotein
MWRSANELAPGSVVEAQVCVVGAGPAGLTLARELAGADFKVLLIESGDFRNHRKLKELNEGDTFGDHYPNPRWHRVRRVGGCTNRWLVDIGGGRLGARFVPLDSIDFETRDWMPGSGWPITRTSLDPYYERAHRHCGIGPYRYDLAAWSEPAASAIETDGLETSIFQFGPKTQWTGRAEKLFQDAPNMDVLLNATVTEIETDASGTVATGLKVLNGAGQPIAVKAQIVVLAVGCVETSRLLLNSHAVHPAGIGNAEDVVGRYFMDHPQSYLNVFRPADRGLFDRTGIYDLRPQGAMAIMAKLAFKDAALRRDELPNSCHLLFPRRDHFLSEAFQSFFSLVLDIRHLSVPRGLGRHLRNMIVGISDLAPIALWALQGTAHYPYLSHGGWADLERKSELFTAFEIWSMVEQAPSPENRVRLGAKRDQNGMPKVEIHWRFTEADRDGVRRMRAAMKREIEGSGLGTIEWSPDLFTTPSSVHPIGGARMGLDPRTSVVGPDLAVHGVDNLYLASSAVFPTSGYANPTLTVVALACRLADRIKRVLAAPIRAAAAEPAMAQGEALPSLV